MYLDTYFLMYKKGLEQQQSTGGAHVDGSLCDGVKGIVHPKMKILSFQTHKTFVHLWNTN